MGMDICDKCKGGSYSSVRSSSTPEKTEMSPGKKKAIAATTIVALLALGSVLAIIGTGGFSHFAQVTRDAFTAPTHAWISVATGGGALLVGVAVGSLIGCRAAKSKQGTEKKDSSLINTHTGNRNVEVEDGSEDDSK